VQTKNDNFIVFTGLRESLGFQIYDRTFNASTNPTIDVADLPDLSGANDAYDKMMHLPFSDADRSMMNLLSGLVFRLLLTMNARKELIESGFRAGRHKKTGAEIWTPNIVGRNYRISRPATSSGEGSQKRLHWRRGHFRNQAIGARRAEHKLIWIEPTLVGK
jgi:hypothetical protein